MRLVALILALLPVPAVAQDDLGDALKSQIVPCWNVAALDNVEDYIWTFVSFDLDRDGKVIGNEVTWQESRGGSADEAAAMFETIRRAVLRCGQAGFDLPADHYDEWREVNITFAINGEA